MRTTVDLNEELLRAAKEKANREGKPLRAVFEEALRALVQTRGGDGASYHLHWHTEKGRLRPGVRLDDRDSLFDFMEGRD